MKGAPPDDDDDDDDDNSHRVPNPLKRRVVNNERKKSFKVPVTFMSMESSEYFYVIR